MFDSFKEVKFDEYCPTCKFETTDEKDAPCNVCLEVPYRDGTQKPECWKEKE